MEFCTHSCLHFEQYERTLSMLLWLQYLLLTYVHTQFSCPLIGLRHHLLLMSENVGFVTAERLGTSSAHRWQHVHKAAVCTCSAMTSASVVAVLL